jgi:chondroitin 4-sulfotransferase 11
MRVPPWAVKYVEPTSLRHALVRDRFWILRELATHADSKYSLEPLFRLRCIFFHIPKTAGLALCDAWFGNRAAGHINVETARAVFGEWRFRSYFKFCVVRNPWDRLVSAYHYLRQGHPNSPIVGLIQESGSFTDFVKGPLSLPIVQSELHVKPQHVFVVDEHKRLRVDYVGRYERLQHDFNVIARRLGVAATLGKRNRSPHSDYRDYYDRESRRIVSELYRRDIELFGYDFDG